MMHPQKQPTMSTCGQTCLAIVSGLPVAQLQRLIRKRGRTHPANIEHGLLLIGKREVRKVRLGLHDALPAPSILRVRAGQLVNHWVVWDGESIIDPLIGERAGLEGYVRFRLERLGARFTMAITWWSDRPAHEAPTQL